jgi:hemoglobin
LNETLIPEAIMEEARQADIERAIALCVQRFYERAHDDPLLGPVMTNGVSDWEAHLAAVRDFWSRALLGTERYTGRAFPPHERLALKREHFSRWLAVFAETARETLPEPEAGIAIAKAVHMSECFQAKLFPQMVFLKDIAIRQHA